VHQETFLARGNKMKNERPIAGSGLRIAVGFHCDGLDLFPAQRLIRNPDE
jgi:hypothetical protein